MSHISFVPFSEVNSCERWDSEYYRSDLRALGDLLNHQFFCPLGDRFSVVSGLTPADRDDSLDAGVVLLKTANIRDIPLRSNDDYYYIDEETDERMASTRLRAGDVLLNIVGASLGVIGRSSIVPEGFPPANITQAMVRLRSTMTEKDPEFIPPEFLFAFFQTRLFQSQVERVARPSNQLNLNHQEVRAFRIPRRATAVGSRVVELIRSVTDHVAQAKAGYGLAQRELLERLGWDSSLERREELYYSLSMKNMAAAGRLDAEHFHPQHKRLHEHLHSRGARLLGEFCTKPTRGIQPEYVADGPIRVINSRHLGPTFLDLGSSERTSTTFCDSQEAAKARLRQFDVLMYSTGAYIGRTNAYLDTALALASNHVSIIRPDNEVCDPVYLALFLNSPPGIIQSEQYASGSAQREIYPSDLNQILVYLPRTGDEVDLDWQKALRSKVVDAAAAHRKAKDTLTEAVSLVESALEQALQE